MPVPHHSVFLQAGCPSCRPTNSVKALKALNAADYCPQLMNCGSAGQSLSFVLVKQRLGGAGDGIPARSLVERRDRWVPSHGPVDCDKGGVLVRAF